MSIRLDAALVALVAAMAVGSLACSATDGLKLGAASFRHAYSDPRIPGLDAEQRTIGGRLDLGLHNTGTKPVRIEKIMLNGGDAEELIRQQRLFWWRVWPEEIAPGSVTTLTLAGPRPLLQEGAQLEITVRGTTGATATVKLDLATPALRLAYAVPTNDFRTLLVWLRNDDEVNTLRLRDVTIASVESSAEPLSDTIPPGRSTIVRLHLKRPLTYLEPLQLIARATDQRGRSVECMAPIRAFVAPFPVGTWVGPTRERDHLEALARIGIDGLINGGGPDAVTAMDELYPKHGFGLLSHVGWGASKINPFVLENVAPKPWCYTLALMDEPDLHPRGPDTDMRSSIYTYLGGIEVWRRCTVRTTFVNLCNDAKFSEFAGMTDILGYDAYAIGAPGIERSHVGYARDLESAAYYTWDLKRCAEPGPIWVWGQGYHAWVYRLLAGVMLTGQPGRAMVTPSEMRVQVVEQLGRGAKGLWWFLALSNEGTRKAFYKEIGEEGAEFGIKQDQVDALVEKAMEPWDELWVALGQANSMVRQIRPVLTYADPYQQFVQDVRWTGRADVATVAGEDALVIFAANLGYYHTLQGARFQPINALSLTVDCPPWVDVRDAFEVTPDGPRDVKWTVDDGKLTIDGGALADVKIFVAAASGEMRGAMAKRAIKVQ